MTPEIRTQLQTARSTAYNTIMATTMFTFAAIAAIIHLGDGSYSAPLMVLTIAVTIYGILAGGTCLDDIAKLAEGMDEDTAKSPYGQQAQARNMSGLKMISSVLLGLVGLAEIFAIVV